MRNPKNIVLLILLSAVVVAGCFFDVYSFTRYSCLECRATLTKRRIGGIPFQGIAYDGYSASVLTRDPTHQHQWRWWGSTHSYSLVSMTFACGRQHPIWQLPISVQAKYAQKVSPAELQRTLQAIDSPDRTTAQAEVERVYEQVLDSR